MVPATAPLRSWTCWRDGSFTPSMDTRWRQLSVTSLTLFPFPGLVLAKVSIFQGAIRTVAFSRAGDLFASGGSDGQVGVSWLDSFTVADNVGSVVFRGCAGPSITQVLMWRTNFDTKSYQDVLQQHSRRSTPDPPPHLSDVHPRGPHLHHPQSTAIHVSSVFLNPTPDNVHNT